MQETDATAAQAILAEEGYDAEQIEMMAEAVILVDELDNEIGRMTKVDSHKGEGHLHRAFSILVFDDQDRLLLQKRATDKITFPGVWANTVCSHPLSIDGETDSLGLGTGAKVAAVRKMEQEMGIPIGMIPTEDIHFVTRMMYRARADEIWVEHELDHILFARAPENFAFESNPNEIADTAWVTQAELEEWLANDRARGEIIAPWFRCIAEEILPEWWGNLDSLPAMADEVIRDMGDVSHMMPEADAVPGEALMTALKVHKDAVEARIESALSNSGNERLSAAMMHLIEGGGKRLRAILPHLVADAVGTPNDGLYDLGAAIEIIHNFTLVHDDIMDNDPIRRGRPAVHIAFDHPTAINAGDAMLAIAFEVLANSDHTDDAHFRQLVHIVGGMVRRVSEGQQEDMSFEDREEVSEAEYLHMISGKTAAMFTTCARTGSLLAGASADVVETMAEWGENVGLCFQLMDDLIDATGDTDTLGKPACSDVIEGKQTLIAIHALEQDASILPTFHEVFGSGDEDTDRDVLDTVVTELENSGSIAYAKQQAMAYHAAAHACLDRLEQTSGMQVLRDLTDFQLIRIS